MARVKSKGAVQWCLPGKKRPFMYSTKAESDWIEILAGDGHTWRSALGMCVYGETEKAICTAFIDAGYGDRLLTDFVRAQ